MANGYWQFKTSAGTIFIAPLNGRYVVIWDNQDLGSYHTPEAAVDDVAGGHTFTPSGGTDLGELEIPYDLPEWEFIKRP